MLFVFSGSFGFFKAQSKKGGVDKEGVHVYTWDAIISKPMD